MPHLDNQTIQLALVAAVALAMLIQAIVLVAALIALRKLAKSIRDEMEDLRSAIMPVIENTRDLIKRVTPRIMETTTDLAALTRSLRNQTAEVQAAADEIIGRAQRQARRVDAMLSSVLDAVDRAGSFMADTVTKPIIIGEFGEYESEAPNNTPAAADALATWEKQSCDLYGFRFSGWITWTWDTQPWEQHPTIYNMSQDHYAIAKALSPQSLDPLMSTCQ